MGRLAAYGVTTGLLWIAAAVAATAAPRGGFFAPGSAPRAPEVMLYFSHSIGAGGAVRPTFGLRVNQVHLASNSGDPESGESMQHRELLNWQMEAHSNLRLADMRVQLGRRVTYDVTSRRFGSPASLSAMQLSAPTLRNGSLNPSQPKPLFARSLAPTTSRAEASDANRDSSSIREIAVAAMTAFAPARLAAAQRQAAQRPRGSMIAIVAAQRAASAHGSLN